MAPIVKICGLSTPATLDAALDAGADMVGFVFFPKSPRHVEWKQARALGLKARGRATIVALTVDADDDALKRILDALEPDVLQLHGRESPARVKRIGEGPSEVQRLVVARSMLGTARRPAPLPDVPLMHDLEELAPL